MNITSLPSVKDRFNLKYNPIVIIQDKPFKLI